MNMKRLQIAFALLFAISMGADAQGFLKKLKDKVKEKVENKIENKVDKVVDSEVDDLLGDGKKSETKKANQQDVDDHWGSEPKEDAPTAATSSDFKRGSVVMFQDDVTAEQVGEFPSKWDLIEGSAEVKTLGGKKAIEVTNGGIITPLIKEKGAYLPEEFTIEYDFYYWNRREDIGLNDIKLCLANKDDRSANPLSPSDNAFTLKHIVCDGPDHGYDYNNGSWGETKSGGFN